MLTKMTNRTAALKWLVLLGIIGLGVIVMAARSGQARQPGAPQGQANPQKPAPNANPTPANPKNVKANPSLTLLLNLRSEEVLGFWAVMVTAALLFIVIIGISSFQWIFRSRIFVYRPYEMKLLNQGKLKLKDLMDYHAQYHWGDYAAITVGMVLLSVTMLVLEKDKLAAVELLIMMVAVAFMTVSATVLCFADLVHTNTQSPIIPIISRFRLIDFSVVFGLFGTLLMVLSIIMLISLINLYVTLSCCGVFCLILLITQMKRPVNKTEFFAYFRVHEKEGWARSDHPYIDHSEQAAKFQPVDVWPYQESSVEALQLYQQIKAATAVPANPEQQSRYSNVLQEIRRLLQVSLLETELFEQQQQQRQAHWQRIHQRVAEAGMILELEQILNDLKAQSES